MVKQDMSNYWVPSLMYRAQNGSFTPVKQTGTTIYYLQRQANDTEKLHAFPKNFRMIAGDTNARNYTGTTAASQVTYACLGYSPAKAQTNNIPDYDCPDGLRSQIFFPSCWDGVNVDSPDHKSHVAYPSGGDTGSCPDTHPVRLISIFYEVLWSVTDFKDMWYSDGSEKHPFVFSNGDATGYGYHGDFVMGWDYDTLDNAVQNCNDPSGDITKCSNVLEFFTSDEQNNCYAAPRVDEQTTGWMEKLPGCNDVTFGPEPVVVETSCANSVSKLSVAEKLYTDVSNLGWDYVGCVFDSLDARVLPTSYSNDNMTVAECVDYCGSKGSSYAGLEYSSQCYCGSTVDSTVLNSTDNKCLMMCAGDDTQYCGDAAKLSLYKKGSSSTTASAASGSASASSKLRRHLQKHARHAGLSIF